MKHQTSLFALCALFLGLCSSPAWADGSVSLAEDASHNYWATFSNISDAVFIPFGSGTVHVYTVGYRETSAGAVLVLYPLTTETIDATEGYFVPAATGVLIKAAANSVTYNTVTGSSAVSFPATNLLHAANGPITAVAGHTYYKLAYGTMINEGQGPVYDLSTLGFFYGAEGGGSYTPANGKAYLDIYLAASSAPARFVIEEMEEETSSPTDLHHSSPEATDGSVKLIHGTTILILKDGVTYDLSGRTSKTQQP